MSRKRWSAFCLLPSAAGFLASGFWLLTPAHAADKKLTEIAESAINVEAAHAQQDHVQLVAGALMVAVLAIMTEVILIGSPSFFKSLSASMVVIVTNNLLRLIGGDSALSVFAIVNRLYSGLNTPQTGIMQGMQPILGYNFGQKRFGRVRKTIIYSLGTATAYGLIVCSLCLLLPAPLIALLIFFGFYPKPLLDVINPAVTATMHDIGKTDPTPSAQVQEAGK